MSISNYDNNLGPCFLHSIILKCKNIENTLKFYEDYFVYIQIYKS